MLLVTEYYYPCIISYFSPNLILTIQAHTSGVYFMEGKIALLMGQYQSTSDGHGSGVATQGHAGARALATRGHAPPVQR